MGGGPRVPEGPETLDFAILYWYCVFCNQLAITNIQWKHFILKFISVITLTRDTTNLFSCNNNNYQSDILFQVTKFILWPTHMANIWLPFRHLNRNISLQLLKQNGSLLNGYPTRNSFSLSPSRDMYRLAYGSWENPIIIKLTASAQSLGLMKQNCSFMCEFSVGLVIFLFLGSEAYRPSRLLYFMNGLYWENFCESFIVISQHWFIKLYVWELTFLLETMKTKLLLMEIWLSPENIFNFQIFVSRKLLFGFPISLNVTSVLSDFRFVFYL